MLEFLATALAIIMVPSAPLNASDSVSYASVDNGTQMVQPYSQIEVPFTPYKLKAFHGTEIDAYTAPERYDSNDVLNWNNYFRNGYTNAYGATVSLDNVGNMDASTTYNDHGFAWGMNGVGTQKECWILDVYQLIDNKSFIEVDTPQKGDIILYYCGRTMDGGYEYTHSGVVIETLGTAPNGVCGNANTVMVVSKWIYGSTHISRGDLCPYVGDYTHEGLEPAYGVAYFRPHSEHNYNEYEITETTHTSKCACGLKGKTEEHAHNAGYTKFNNSTYHYSNCKCGHQIEELHFWQPYFDDLLTFGIDPDYGINPMIIPSKNKLCCKYCNFIKILKDDEIIILPGH